MAINFHCSLKFGDISRLLKGNKMMIVMYDVLKAKD
jgi:hypothetical protein